METFCNTIAVFVRNQTGQVIAQYDLLHYPSYQPGDALHLHLPLPGGGDRTLICRVAEPVIHHAAPIPGGALTKVSLNVAVSVDHDSAEEETQSLTTNQPDHV